MPVHSRRGLDFENRDFYRVSKIEDNFKCNFFACYGLFSLFTFEKKRNWLRVIGTLNIKIGNEIIERVHNTNFLGLIIDDDLSWKHHIRIILLK